MATKPVPNEQKFTELVLYIANKCADDPTFGAIKLNKLLFHADFLAYGEFGESITGMEYMKLENGPAPRRLVPIRKQMEERRDAVLQLRRTPTKPRDQHRLIALREADLSGFTANEIALVDDLIQGLWNVPGEKLSELTHRYRGWCVARKLKDTIPYASVFLSDEPPTDYEVMHAGDLVTEYGWDV